MSTTSDKTFEVAKLMVERYKHPVATTFDPMLILALVSVVFQAIKFVRECSKDPAAGRTVLNRPGFLRTRRLRKLIAEHLPEGVSQNEAELALRAVGTTLTVADVAALYHEQEITDLQGQVSQILVRQGEVQG